MHTVIDVREKISEKLQWSTIRSVGSIQALRASYIAIALLPFAAAENDVTRALDFNGGPRFALSYFAALSLAIAKLAYDIACPGVIKRFERTSDLTIHMRQAAGATDSPTSGNKTFQQTAEAQWHHDNQRFLPARVICSVLFAVGGGLTSWLLITRSIAVIDTLW